MDAYRLGSEDRSRDRRFDIVELLFLAFTVPIPIIFHFSIFYHHHYHHHHFLFPWVVLTA